MKKYFLGACPTILTLLKRKQKTETKKDVVGFGTQIKLIYQEFIGLHSLKKKKIFF